MVQLSALIFVVAINKQQTARLLACKRKTSKEPIKNSLLDEIDEDMIFSKNTSSSFGSDSDFDLEEPNRKILGGNNNKMTLRVNPAKSTDKTAHLHNLT